MKQLIAFISIVIAAQINASVLEETIQAMKPGTWRPLVTPGLTVDMLKTGDPNPVTVYSTSRAADWDPLTEQIIYMGAGHYKPMCFNIYSVKTNSWRKETARPAGSDWLSHSYDNKAMDKNGNYFIQHHGNNGGDSIFVYNTLSGTWTGSFSALCRSCHYGSLKFFPEMNSLTYCLGGSLWTMDMETKQVQTRASGLTMEGLHNLSFYNPIHKVLLFGGGGYDGRNSAALYKMDSTGAITRLRDAPMTYQVNGCPVIAIEPVTGEMLFFTEDSVYGYDLPTQTYHAYGKSYIDMCIETAAVPLPEYGAIVFLASTRYPFLIYKHAEKQSTTEKGNGISLKPGSLSANPNPFNPSTTLLLSGDMAEGASLKVFDASGRCAADLSNRIAGGKAVWNAAGLASGAYLVIAEKGGQSMKTRIIYLR